MKKISFVVNVVLTSVCVLILVFKIVFQFNDNVDIFF